MFANDSNKSIQNITYKRAEMRVNLYFDNLAFAMKVVFKFPVTVSHPFGK